MSKFTKQVIYYELVREYDLSINEYCLLYLIDQSQKSKEYGINGYSTMPYSKMSEVLGLSKSSLHKIVKRLVADTDLLYVHPEQSTTKRVDIDFSTKLKFYKEKYSKTKVKTDKERIKDLENDTFMLRDDLEIIKSILNDMADLLNEAKSKI